MALAWILVAVLGSVIDTGVDRLSLIGCSIPMGIFVGIAVTTGNYFRAEIQIQTRTEAVSQRKSLL
jgi:hypothetical protein